MNITDQQLAEQYSRAVKSWPWIHDVEKAHGLPWGLLFALGSRETNLGNVAGDYTQRFGEPSKRYHGFGVWQRDSGAFPGTDQSYLSDVHRQAEDAAGLVTSNAKALGGDLRAGVAAYNGGVGNVRRALASHEDVDARTTGQDYSADVFARRDSLEKQFRTLPKPAPASKPVPAPFTPLGGLLARLTRLWVRPSRKGA